MKNDNNNLSFAIKLFHVERNGRFVYRMVEYKNNQITKEFEAEKIKICLDHFQLPSDDDYVIYWMLNSEEVKIYEQEPFSKN